MKSQIAVLGLMGLTSINVAFAAEPERGYIQAAKADLKAEPKMDSKSLTQLKRGDPLTIEKKEGIWNYVKVGNKAGWVSKLFISATKPVGAAELSQNSNNNLEKSSRRRSSSYAVSAATRGLTAEGRSGNRESLQSDFEALSTMEKDVPSDDKLNAFSASGK
ncbi:SH3 domain-containing protein [Bdellovibrionota bacterium FG-2]